ncbi:MAG: arsenate reductase ArsC [Methylococcales bacterium]|nr:arsenate reductase ArsC [Methylococcales bacterium]
MLKVLILCTGNSCRSVLGEALINHTQTDRLQAFSAGSRPLGKINTNALATLKRNGIATDGFTSQSWNEFADQDIDIAITVCDSAAGEACPVYLNSVVRGHWGLPDPAHVSGSEEEIAAAFQATYNALEKRIQQLLALPFETMPAAELTLALNKIGTETL